MATTPSAIDLTWLAAVKRRAEMDPTQMYPDDVEIQKSITAFSRYMLNRSGAATLNSVVTLSENYDGNGNDVLFLRTFPVLSLSSVVANGVSLQLSSGYGAWGAFVMQNGKAIALRGPAGGQGPNYAATFPYPSRGWNASRGPVFPEGRGNIQVGYTGGSVLSQVNAEVHTVTGGQITLDESPWTGDKGVVYYPSLVPLAPVLVAPAIGQYNVLNASAGIYTFNAGDDGQQVAVSYSVRRAPEDLEFAIRCAVAINYKRKGWLDQASRTVSSQGTASTTRYRDWEWPPEIECVFEYYTRRAVIT